MNDRRGRGKGKSHQPGLDDGVYRKLTAYPADPDLMFLEWDQGDPEELKPCARGSTADAGCDRGRGGGSKSEMISGGMGVRVEVAAEGKLIS